MTHNDCDLELVTLYALGALKDGGRDVVDRHLRWCAVCQAEVAGFEKVTNMLRELPSEALLSGPPEGGDLVLQRTLRVMRAELSTARRRRSALVATIAAGIMAAAMVGGVALGQSMAPQVGGGSQVAAAPATLAPGTRTNSATDPVTAASMTVTLVPAAGWVRLKMIVHGIPAGENCRVLVVSRSGQEEVAAGWIASAKSMVDGVTLDGAAALAPDDVVMVAVVNTAGTEFVTVKI